MEKLDVVTFGEAMAMFVADDFGRLDQINHFTKYLAGAETNVAVGLARLGLRSGWASRVGADSFGTFVKRFLETEGVNIDQVKEDLDFPTGFQMKSKVEAGDPEVQYFRKRSAASRMNADDLTESYFTAARHLHMTGIPLALSDDVRAFSLRTLQVMKQAGRTVSFDPNLRPSLWKSEEEMIRTVNHAACQADWVLPGISEGEILTGSSCPEEIAAFYLDRGVSFVAVKLGEEGAYLATPEEQKVVPGFPVDRVVDTVGAGDGFAVGVISALLEGDTFEEAVGRGNRIGALAVQAAGDLEGLPTREQLDFYTMMRRS